jgi:hypothetical protein
MKKVFFLISISFVVVLFFFGLPKKLFAETMAPHTHSEEKHTHPVEKHSHSDRPHLHEELQQIRLWLDSIERDTERRRITGEEDRVAGEKVYPLQTLRKTRLSGGLTFIVQGALNNEKQFGGDRADGSFSLDLILESEIRKNGLMIIRGDFMRGDGLTRLPDLFAGGVNADIEDLKQGDTFKQNPATFNLIEALYEQTWEDERYRLSFGQMDPTSYFDQNAFANSETFQFLSPMFVNNIAILLGGDANGYGPGLVAHVHPVKTFEINVGFFEGNGEYDDMLDQPFWIIEAEYENYRGELEGHYRFIYWSNETNQNMTVDASATLSRNSGFAISFDQEMTKQVGVWARFGTRDGAVSQYDRSASIGFQLKGLLGREDGIFGFAYGRTFVSDEYEQVSNSREDEQVIEAYYNMDAGRGFHLAPDVQYIENPGGDGAIDPITVYGVRAQLNF